MRNPVTLAAAVLFGSLATNSGVEAQNVPGNPVTAAAMAVEANAVQRVAGNVNARDYGAIGDGVADDTVAIQAALAAAANKGPVCLVPAGHYRVNGA